MDDTHSIPIIPLYGQLIVPLQGIIADHQAAQLSRDVLRCIERDGAQGLVLDVSGVALIDSHLCSVLARLAQAASLMGTRSVICGLNAELVLTLLAMGVEFERVDTALSLEEALLMLGIAGVRLKGDSAAMGEWLDIAGDAADNAQPQGEGR